MKEAIRDLEDVRNASGEVRSFRHVHGHIKGAEDYSNHPEGCTCGHCGKDHDHTSMGHIPKHSHGDGCNHHHEHEHKRKRRGPVISCGCCHDEEGEDEHGHDHDHDHGEHVLWELVLGGIVFIRMAGAYS